MGGTAAGRELGSNGDVAELGADPHLSGQLIELPGRDPTERIAEILGEWGWGRCRIGFEANSYYTSPRAYLTLRGRLPDADIVDADLLVAWVRAVKSDAEIECMRQAARIAERAMTVALAAVRPGRRCEDVEAAWRHSLEGTGFGKDSRLGYTIGLSYPPNWGERTASFRPGDTTVLEPNMTFHLLGGIWLDDWGYELSETIRVTDDGVESLTLYGPRLFVKV